MRQHGSPAGDDDSTASRLLSPLRTPAAGEVLADRIMTAIALVSSPPGSGCRPSGSWPRAWVSAARQCATRWPGSSPPGCSKSAGDAPVARSCAGHGRPNRRGLFVPRWGRGGTSWRARSTCGILVEALVARTAAERRDAADTREIRAALRQYERATELPDAQAADLRLHHAIAKAAKNPRLLAVREQLLSEVSFGFAVEPFTDEVYARALPQHRELAAAVIAQDAGAAWEIGRQHFAITDDELRAALWRAVQGTEAQL